MDINSILKEDVFFEKYPLITFLPKELVSDNRVVRQYQGYITADVCFATCNNESISIEEEISILIPDGYPRNLPRVFLLKNGQIITYGVDFHFYNDTKQLCLGLDWELRDVLYKDPSLLNLTESFIIPHIAATRYVLECPSSRRYPQGEYSHGIIGKIEGLASFFNIPQNEKNILDVLHFLSKPHKVANKMLCPFGCGMKYGHCQCKGNINRLQKLIPPKEANYMIREIIDALAMRQFHHKRNKA